MKMPQTRTKSLRTPQRRLCASLRNRNAHGHLTRSIPRRNLQEKYRAPEVWPTFCASLRGRNAHEHVTRTILCEHLQEKRHASGARKRLFASLHSRNAHRHLTRAILCENFEEKYRTPRKTRTADFARVCAVEMHMDMSQAHFLTYICKKKAGTQMEHPKQAGLNSYCKHPSVWTRCLVKC